MNLFLRNTLQTIYLEAYMRLYFVAFGSDWRIIRLLMGVVMLGVGSPTQYWLFTQTEEFPLYRTIYIFLVITTAIMGVYYLVIGSDPQDHTAKRLVVRYRMQVFMTAQWIFGYIIDFQAHAFSALRMDDAAWYQYQSGNIIVIAALFFATMNGLARAVRAHLYEETDISPAILELKEKSLKARHSQKGVENGH
jgi:hypothetical protein